MKMMWNIFTKMEMMWNIFEVCTAIADLSASIDVTLLGSNSFLAFLPILSPAFSYSLITKQGKGLRP